MRSLLLALLVSGAGAQENWVPTAVYKFGGLDTYHDSSQLDPGDAQDAENVLTDAGYLEKRPGNTRIAQILSGYAIKYAAQFIAPSSTKYLIAHSSDTVYRTDLSSAGVVAISTIGVNYSVDSTVAFGKTIITDGLQSAMTFDGNSTGTVSGMPVCVLTEFWQERVVCANIPAENTARVRVSSASSMTTWDIPANVATVDDPANGFDFQKQDGEGITCLKTTPWGLVVGKRHSMHILKGVGNTTFYKRVIDPAIGCVDDRSMQMVDGFLLWLGVDGIYSWNGAAPPQIISREIDSLVKSIRQLNSVAAQWVVDSQSDWQAGKITANPPTDSWNTNTTAGSIFPSSNSLVDTNTADFAAGTIPTTITTGATQGQIQLSSSPFRIINGDFEEGSLNNWTCATNSGSCTCAVAGGSAINGAYGAQLQASCGGLTNVRAHVYILDSNNNVLRDTDYASSSTILSGGTLDLSGISTQTLRVRFNANLAGGSDCDLTSTTFTAISSFSWTAVSGGNCPSGSFGFGQLDDVKVNRHFSQYQSSQVATFYSRVFDTSFSTPIGGPLSVSSSAPAGTSLAFQFRSSTVSTTGPWNSWTTFYSTDQITKSGRYQQYLSSFTSPVGTSTPVLLDLTETYASSGTYYSDVHYVGTAITLWKTADWTDSQTPASTLLYSVRAATWSFTKTDVTVPWTSQTNHQTIRISTNTYFQFRIESSSMTSSSMSLTVSRFAANWQEGSEKPVASGTIDHRYFLCATLSTTTTNNDACLVLQKNNKWTKFTGPSIGAMTLYDNNLVGGDGGTNSYAWKMMQSGVYQDDGSAISSYWTTKDYIGDPAIPDSIFREKVLYEMWVDAAVTSSTMTVSYAANKGSTFTSKSVPLNVSTNYLNKRIPWDAGYVLGKYHRFKFSNSTIDQYFRLNGFLFYSETKDRTQD